MGKHAAPRRRRASVGIPRAAAKVTLMAGGLAASVTGVAVASGVAAGDHDSSDSAAAVTQVSATTAQSDVEVAAELEGRGESLSRSSDRRAATDPAKAASLAAAVTTQVKAVTATEDASEGDPKAIASALLSDYGWSGSQFTCLDKLWTKESGWNPRADNPSSSAYGIPQALPGSKMASAGPNWQTNPVTQIKWGLGYIQGRYGNPCGAWGHSVSHGWY